MLPPMSLKVNPWLAALFGSETRVRTLAPLANAPEPLTAYRIAQVSDVNRIKVYEELRNLAAAGIVRERVTGPKRSVWELPDSDVRRILRKRARVVWVGDLEREATDLARRARAFRALYAKNPINLSRFKAQPSRVSHPEEYRRPPEKDRILASLGLKTSSRASDDR